MPRRQQTVISDSESSETEDSVQDGEIQHLTRSSERLHQKRSRQFQKPSRDQVWEKISLTKSPDKYDHLKPKRLVNDFTKENNRYNFDPNESSGDESMDDFLADSEEETNSDTDDYDAVVSQAKKKQVSPRIQGRRHRLVMLSDSDDDSSHADSFTLGSRTTNSQTCETNSQGFEVNTLDSEDLEADTTNGKDHQTIDTTNMCSSLTVQDSGCQKNAVPPDIKGVFGKVDDKAVTEVKPSLDCETLQLGSSSLSKGDSGNVTIDSDEDMVTPNKSMLGRRSSRLKSNIIESDDSSSDEEITSPRRKYRKSISNPVIESDNEQELDKRCSVKADKLGDVECGIETENCDLDPHSKSRTSCINDVTVKAECCIKLDVHNQPDTSANSLTDVSSNNKEEISDLHEQEIQEGDVQSVQTTVRGSVADSNDSKTGINANFETDIQKSTSDISQSINGHSSSDSQTLSSHDGSSASDSGSDTDDSDTDNSEITTGDSDDNYGSTKSNVIGSLGRVRVEMMKKKREKEKLFDQLRANRQRKLLKQARV